MMTEEQAKMKWCPYARVLVDLNDNDRGPTSANRLETAGTNEMDLEWGAARCIASECMAWRELAQSLGVTHGYCGLAGAP